MVNFYFDKSSVLQYIRQERMTKVDYISQIGGLLGLFMGISFISGIELIYWATVRLTRNMDTGKSKKIQALSSLASTQRTDA